MLKRHAGPFVFAAVLIALIGGCGRTNQATTVPATTVPATTVPATTVPATTVPATTVPATTSPTMPISSSGSPLVVCGQTLSTSAAAPVVYDLASRRYPTDTGVTVGGVIYVQVSNSCSTGAMVKLTPPAAFTTVRTVRATDGRAVLVELRPDTKPVATLTATLAGGAPELLRLDVAPAFLPGPSCTPPTCPPRPLPSIHSSIPITFPMSSPNPKNAAGTGR